MAEAGFEERILAFLDAWLPEIPAQEQDAFEAELRALNGGRDSLSREELELVGVDPDRPLRTPGGWVFPDEVLLLRPPYENGADLSPEDFALLSSLLAVGSTEARFEFLGGPRSG